MTKIINPHLIYLIHQVNCYNEIEDPLVKSLKLVLLERLIFSKECFRYINHKEKQLITCYKEIKINTPNLLNFIKEEIPTMEELEKVKNIYKLIK